MTVQNWARLGLILITLGYPFLLYFGLQHFDLWLIAIVLIFMGIARLVSQSNQVGPIWLWPTAALSLAGIALYFQDALALKLYPVFVNVMLLLVFSHSLSHPPTVIERLARLTEPDLPEHAVAYTRWVTVVWCAFFTINGGIALFTTLHADEDLWLLYNGVIAYLLMGFIFIVEWLVRQKVRKNA